ncbi:S1 family peptidase [Desulfosporosinus fructosivorans]
MDFQSAYKIIRPSIVGIGFTDFQGNCQIIGTGFIVHSSGWIMSNRHVLEPLLVESDCGIKIRPDAAVMLFVNGIPDPNFVGVVGVIPAKITELAFSPIDIENLNIENKKYNGLEPIKTLSPEEPDIGVCKIELKDLPPEATQLKAVKIIDSNEFEEGTNIGIIGFPQGLSISETINSISLLQLTPILQVGIISAILPFSGIPNPSNFILDLFINGGSSGSPLFTEKGEVIGIVFATRQVFNPLTTISNGNTSNDTGVYTTSGLGLAIPSSRFPKEWLSKD